LNNGKMYYDLYGVEKTIRRAKEAGMALVSIFIIVIVGLIRERRKRRLHGQVYH
jgi:hypothetical protein